MSLRDDIARLKKLEAKLRNDLEGPSIENLYKVWNIAPRLIAQAERMEAALKPFADITSSSFYAPDGSDNDGYNVYLSSRVKPDFLGADLYAAREALKHMDGE